MTRLIEFGIAAMIAATLILWLTREGDHYAGIYWAIVDNAALIFALSSIGILICAWISLRIRSAMRGAGY